MLYCVILPRLAIIARYRCSKTGHVNRSRCLLRVSELASIEVNWITFTLLFTNYEKPTVTSPLFSLSVFTNSACCPVDDLWAYLDRTKPYRGLNDDSLFIALIAPFKAVSSGTVVKFALFWPFPASMWTPYGLIRPEAPPPLKLMLTESLSDTILQSGHCARSRPSLVFIVVKLA